MYIHKQYFSDCFIESGLYKS